MNSEIPTAFPWAHGNVSCTGMGLRDYFAAKAMQGFITGDYDLHPHEAAQKAYGIADEMIKARGLA
jgi:hypothetical protein